MGPSRPPSMFCWKVYQGGNLAARSFCTKPSNQSPGRMVLTMLRISRTKRGLVSNQQRLFPSQRKRTFTGLCQVVNVEQSPPSTQYTIVYEMKNFGWKSNNKIALVNYNRQSDISKVAKLTNKIMMNSFLFYTHLHTILTIKNVDTFWSQTLFKSLVFEI